MKNIINLFKNKKIIYGISGLILLIILYNWFQSDDEGLIYKVVRDDLSIDIEVDGEIKALDSYVIKAPSNIWRNARIVKLVPEGDLVKENDFLIQLDPSEFQQRLMEAQNKLETTEANLASVTANIKSQTAELESNIKLENYSLKQSRLRAKNAVYESENKRKEIEFSLKKAEISYQQLMDKRVSTKKINRAKLRQAELEVEQAQIKLKRAQDDIGKLTIISPAEGLVVYMEVWEGNQMGKLKVGYSPWRSQALMEIPTQNKMKACININEVNISKLELEQEAVINLDAVPDTTFTGNVKDIAALAHKDRKTKKNVFDVEVYLNENDERLKPGMTVHCRIIVQCIKDTLFVPIDAVNTINEKTIVYDEDGDAIEIKTGVSNSDFIIVQEGLEEGDMIRLKKPAQDDQGKKGLTPSQKKKKKKSSSRSRTIIIG